ncbi:MAG: hypothetical protein AAF512_02780 [Pseudomonadota bacterium]
MKVGSYFPGQQAKNFFAISADDCLLHFAEDEWNEKQRLDDTANKDLIAMLQVGSLFIANPQDHVSLYDGFTTPEWQKMLAFYHDSFQRLGLSPAPLSNVHYYPREGFYQSVAEDSQAADTELVTIYMISGSNQQLHAGSNALEISRHVNSKMRLAESAEEYNLPVPVSMICHKHELASAHVAEFFAKYDNQIILKVMGLAGARNVTPVQSPQEGLEYLAEFSDDIEIVLQEKLSSDEFTEMTVDLFVSDTEVKIDNIRKILFSDGLWVGNYINRGFELSKAQQQVLIKVGEYAREQGYSQPQGQNCGIDFFIKGDEVVVIEINARWTGGLIPAQMIQRLDLDTVDTVTSFDMVSKDRLDNYLAFLDEYRYGQSDADFSIVPLGFSPYLYELEGVWKTHVWEMIIGDYEAFKVIKNEVMGANELMVADTITL